MSSTKRLAPTGTAAALGHIAASRQITPRAIGVVAGYGLLIWTVAVVLFYPNGWLPIWLAGGATALLSLDRKLGPIGAALLVMLAIPVGRGSEVGLPRIPGDIPLRAHDLVPIVGVLMAMPSIAGRLRHLRSVDWAPMVPIAAFAAVGLVALIIGLLGNAAIRDIVRDARWWALYGFGLVALLAGTRRSTILRAFAWGLTIYCAVLVIGLLMPMFHGGLKYGAYAYDPRLRLHYGQAVLLLVAVSFVCDRFVRRPALPSFALLTLLAAGIGVTLTRTLLSGVIAVAVLASAWTALELTKRTSTGRAALALAIVRRGGPAVLAVLIGISAGFGVYRAGVEIWTPGWAYSSEGSGPVGSPTDTRPVRPSLGRVFEDSVNSGFAAQAGGRLSSYARAFADTAESPLLGHGMGALARVPWAWGGFRAYTVGSQPGVDNAYLTVGLKAGAVGIAAFAAMMLWPIGAAWRKRRLRRWFVSAWLAILGLTLIQSFAVSGYIPLALSLLLILPALGARRGHAAA